MNKIELNKGVYGIKTKLYILILVIFISFILFCITSIIIKNSNERKRIADEETAQKIIENYLKDKYPNNKMTISHVDYIDRIQEYVSVVHDENYYEFNVYIYRDSRISDTYSDINVPDVEKELRSRLTSLVEELNGALELRILRVEERNGSENGKLKAAVKVELFDKEKADARVADEEKIDTKEKFAEYVVLIRDEVFKSLNDDYIIDNLYIRLNDFMVDLDNTKLQYNLNEVEMCIWMLDV
jgi:DNA-directed RNA polymerase subunit N (RpoN/RPB10)